LNDGQANSNGVKLIKIRNFQALFDNECNNQTLIPKTQQETQNQEYYQTVDHDCVMVDQEGFQQDPIESEISDPLK